MTRLGTVAPGPKLRFDAFGLGSLEGQTVTNPAVSAPTAVTFNTTAPTPDDGTPPIPVIWTSMVPPAPTLALGAPSPSRVSNTRDGTNEPNEPPAAPAPAT